MHVCTRPYAPPLNHMQGVSKAAMKPDNLMQARDGTLTRILAPLLCGNAQRSLLVNVFDGQKYLAESQVWPQLRKRSQRGRAVG